MDYRALATVFWCFLVIAGSAACAALQPAHVADASKKRDVICQFVDVWAKDQPELKRVDELCEAGADLKEIAAAYAGCSDQ